MGTPVASCAPSRSAAVAGLLLTCALTGPRVLASRRQRSFHIQRTTASNQRRHRGRQHELGLAGVPLFAVQRLAEAARSDHVGDVVHLDALGIVMGPLRR